MSAVDRGVQDRSRRPAPLVVERLAVTDEDRAEARAMNELVEQALTTMPPIHECHLADTRRRWDDGSLVPKAPKLDHAIERIIPGPAGGVPVRMFVPDVIDAVYLHIHGGGWVIGSASGQDHALDRIARRLGAAVVSVDYRLAPEHPYPAAPDDCEAVAAWIVDHATCEFGTDRLLIGGESAGAHLSALTLLRLRDRLDAADRFLGANLTYGYFDLGRTPSVRRWGDRNLVVSTPILEWFAETFVSGHAPEARRHPDVSPLYADLAGLPPALFLVGELDPLLDDSLFMASRWSAAGNDAELIVCPDSIHGFTAFAHGIGRVAAERSIDFLRRRLAAVDG